MAARKRTLEDDVRDRLEADQARLHDFLDQMDAHRRDANAQGANLPPLVHPKPFPKPPAPKGRRRS